MGQSYWRHVKDGLAGVAPTAQYPDGERILPDWANRYRREGLTEDEIQRYRTYMRARRLPRQTPQR